MIHLGPMQILAAGACRCCWRTAAPWVRPINWWMDQGSPFVTLRSRDDFPVNIATT